MYPHCLTNWKPKNWVNQSSFFSYCAVQQTYIGYASAIRLCNTPLHYASAIRLCNTPLQYASARRLCNAPLQGASAMRLCNTPLQYASAIRLCKAPLQCASSPSYHHWSIRQLQYYWQRLHINIVFLSSIYLYVHVYMYMYIYKYIFGEWQAGIRIEQHWVCYISMLPAGENSANKCHELH